MQQVDLLSRRRIPLTFFIVGIAIVLAACSTPYYGPLGFWHDQGYQNERLSPNTWKITYQLDGKKRRPYDLALVRAAWLCKQNGYSWFTVNEAHQQVISEEAPYPQTGYDPIGDEYAHRQPIDSHDSARSSIIISGLKTRAVYSALNCDQVLSTLGTKYKITDKKLKR